MKVLYQLFAKSMLTLSFRITQNMEDSEDILQESFLTSFQQIHTLKIAKTYPAWLKRIVVNNSISATRKQRRFEELTVTAESIEIDEEDDSWYKNVPFEQIKKAINQLPNGCREVFTLYLMEGYKHKEVAEILQISVSTSKSQYRYSLKLLKEVLLKNKVR